MKERREIGNGILAFSFDYPQGFDHRLGQYIEWTLPVADLDDRGNRRYFSIASSPTESELLIAARFYPRSSRYKQVMAAIEAGRTIGLKTLDTLTDPARVPVDWDGSTGYINEKMIREAVPDVERWTSFISGSPGMAESVKKVLHTVGVRRRNIRSDYFPGEASGRVVFGMVHPADRWRGLRNACGGKEVRPVGIKTALAGG